MRLADSKQVKVCVFYHMNNQIQRKSIFLFADEVSVSLIGKLLYHAKHILSPSIQYD